MGSDKHPLGAQPPTSLRYVVAYKGRRQDLAPDMKEMLQRLLVNNICPVDVQRVFETTYPDGPLVTLQDLANMAKDLGNRGGSDDADRLLEMLHDEARKEDGWFIR